MRDVNSVVWARAQGELEECFSHVGIFDFRNNSKSSRNLRLEEAQIHLLRIQKALVTMFGARKNWEILRLIANYIIEIQAKKATQWQPHSVPLRYSSYTDTELHFASDLVLHAVSSHLLTHTRVRPHEWWQRSASTQWKWHEGIIWYCNDVSIWSKLQQWSSGFKKIFVFSWFSHRQPWIESTRNISQQFLGVLLFQSDLYSCHKECHHATWYLISLNKSKYLCSVHGQCHLFAFEEMLSNHLLIKTKCCFHVERFKSCTILKWNLLISDASRVKVWGSFKGLELKFQGTRSGLSCATYYKVENLGFYIEKSFIFNTHSH